MRSALAAEPSNSSNMWWLLGHAYTWICESKVVLPVRLCKFSTTRLLLHHLRNKREHVAVKSILTPKKHEPENIRGVAVLVLLVRLHKTPSNGGPELGFCIILLLGGHAKLSIGVHMFHFGTVCAWTVALHWRLHVCKLTCVVVDLCVFVLNVSLSFPDFADPCRRNLLELHTHQLRVLSTHGTPACTSMSAVTGKPIISNNIRSNALP